MALLTINYPNLEPDTELDVPPHGLFKNGHVYEVDWIEEDKVLGEDLDTNEVLDDPRKTAAAAETEPVEVVMSGADIPAAAGDLGVTVDEETSDPDPEEGE